MKLSTFILTLKTDSRVNQSPSMLRGLFAQKYPRYELLHQHNENKKLIYSYPKIQYKIIDGTPMIVGLNEGTEILKKIYSDTLDLIFLGNAVYRVVEKQVVEKECEFDRTSALKQYQFLTPWLALNQKNYEKYNSINRKEQTMLLHRILIGNILSMAKALEYVVIGEIKVKIRVRPFDVRQKDVSMFGFDGEFKVNFNLPDYIGLGKSVSRGFGTVVRQKTEDRD